MLLGLALNTFRTRLNLNEDITAESLLQLRVTASLFGLAIRTDSRAHGERIRQGALDSLMHLKKAVTMMGNSGHFGHSVVSEFRMIIEIIEQGHRN